MSYMRGEFYIYRGGGKKETINIFYTNPKAKSYQDPISISIPIDIFDELVVMRHAQLKSIEKIEKRAIRKYRGNIGCADLAKKYGKPTYLDYMKLLAAKLKARKKGK